MAELNKIRIVLFVSNSACFFKLSLCGGGRGKRVCLGLRNSHISIAKTFPKMISRAAFGTLEPWVISLNGIILSVLVGMIWGGFALRLRCLLIRGFIMACYSRHSL